MGIYYKCRLLLPCDPNDHLTIIIARNDPLIVLRIKRNQANRGIDDPLAYDITCFGIMHKHVS